MDATVQAWSDDPATNHGWAVLNFDGDVWKFSSSEAGAGLRPSLKVDYTPPMATILDQFNAVAYNGSDGTLPWSDDWREIGDDNDPDMGRVLAGYNALSEQGLLIWKTPAIGAYREADLSGFTTATLSFDWALFSTELGDSVSLEISTDGGLVWNPIDTFAGPANHTVLNGASYDISAYIDSDTRIKFESTTLGDNDEFFVDNVRIELSGAPPPVNDPPTLDLDADNSAGAPGNNYALTYTEGDPATAIADVDADLADVDSTAFDNVKLAISGLLDDNAEEIVLDGDTFALATATWDRTPPVVTTMWSSPPASAPPTSPLPSRVAGASPKPRPRP